MNTPNLTQHSILVPSFIFIFSRDLIFHGLNIIILRGRGKSRIDPGSEDAVKQERSTAFDWSSSTNFAGHFHILGILPIQGAVNHNQSQTGL